MSTLSPIPCPTCGVATGDPGMVHGAPEDRSLSGAACTLTAMLTGWEDIPQVTGPAAPFVAEVRDLLLTLAREAGEPLV